MNKMLVFLDELYLKDSKTNQYVSKYTSGLFFKGFTNTNVQYILPTQNFNDVDTKDLYSNYISVDQVYPLKSWTSNYEFFKKYILSHSFRKDLFYKISQSIVNNEIVWVRLPSYAGLLIAKRTLKLKKKLIIHVAGGIKQSWRSNKYTGITKFIAFLFANYMHYLQFRIIKNKNVLVLVTGDHLIKEYSNKHNNLYFFIDNNINVAHNKSLKENTANINFLFIGRLTKEKGIYILLDGFKSYIDNKKNSNNTLTIVGFGPEEDNIKNYILKHGLENNIKFKGFIPNNKIDTVLLENDFLIMPSISYYEGFPRVIIEAWCYGLGVLSVELEGIRSLSFNEKNILFFKKNDSNSLAEKLFQLSNDIELCNNILSNVSLMQEKLLYLNFKTLIESKINKIL